MWNLNSSDRYEYSGFWRAWEYDEWIPIFQTDYPFISVALSCGMNDFDRTEARSWTEVAPGSYEYYDPVQPIVERILLDPGRGAIAQVGPTRASQVLGNPLFGREFLLRLYEPGASVGRAFLLAQRACLLKYPNYRDLFKSYVLLGDPRLGPNTVTAVAEATGRSGIQLSRPTPNPFNPVTKLRFHIDRPMNTSVMVFDVKGRLVRILSNARPTDAGWSEVIWDGKTVSGSDCGSGVYYVVLRAGGVSKSQRLVLLR